MMSGGQSPKLLGDSYYCQPGPWGMLEVVRVMLAPPLDLTKYFKQEVRADAWFFPALSVPQLETLFQQFGLPSDMNARLLQKAKKSTALGGIEIKLRPETVAELPPEARSKLYSWLANSSDHSPQFNAFRYFGESVDTWLEHANLRASTIDLVRPYIYRHGHFLKFADLKAVTDKLRDAKEAELLIKALSREITLRARLHLNRADDLEGIVAYWGHSHRENDVRPVLESFSHFEQEQTIDIVHLLPPLPRRLLYTYPHPPQNKNYLERTCYWTSLNFFNEEPDNRWLNLGAVHQTIITQWQPITGEPTLGDMALFVDTAGDAYHAAVYIADDILFSKNGPSVVRPWMLIHAKYLQHFYYRETPLEIRYYRKITQ